MDGNVGDLAALRGKWVFVHFWASWCGPCRRELPRLQALPRQLDDNRFAMLLVNTAEDEDTVFTFLAGVAPELYTLMDRDGLATEAWQPRGLPATYLVDPAGRVRYQALGGRPWDEPAYLNFLKALVAGSQATRP
jgi:thiol-disulfide isomerase/thioredoxin